MLNVLSWISEYDTKPTTTTRRPPPPLPQPEIFIQISEPRIEIVEIGNTVTLHCTASSRRSEVRYQQKCCPGYSENN